jgi:hypothetical protein
VFYCEECKELHIDTFKCLQMSLWSVIFLSPVLGHMAAGFDSSRPCCVEKSSSSSDPHTVDVPQLRHTAVSSYNESNCYTRVVQPHQTTDMPLKTFVVQIDEFAPKAKVMDYQEPTTIVHLQMKAVETRRRDTQALS